MFHYIYFFCFTLFAQVYLHIKPLTAPSVTLRNEPPSKGVTAVNTSFARVKRPLSFRLIWPCPEVDSVQECKGEVKGNDVPTSSGSNTDKSGKESGCSLWFPVAPEGYVAVGCVVSTGRVAPSLSSTLCISSSFVSSCALKDCISLHLFEPYVTCGFTLFIIF